MNKELRLVTILLAMATLVSSAAAAAKKGSKIPESEKEIPSLANSVLWRSPGDIRSRNLFFGPGGESHASHTIFTFIKEDMEGTNPKFEVLDQNDVKWKAKLGAEARPETVASRLVWAVGYSAHEDYFLPELHVENLPAHLRRGQNLAGARGGFPNLLVGTVFGGGKKGWGVAG